MPFRSLAVPWKKQRAREFRQDPTRSEAILWERLRGKQRGRRFRRQAIILGWIVDFWCPSVNLVVEIDGPIHEERKTQDSHRDEVLSAKGIRILRVAAAEVERDLEAVLSRINTAVRPGWSRRSLDGGGS